MRCLALLAVLAVPSQAGISLRWAPALELALAELTGPARDVAGGFDGVVLSGLQVRLNEIHALSWVGIDDLDALRRRSAAAVLPDDRRAALERSLALLSPVIARLEAQGVRIDDRGEASTALGPALSRALVAEAREADRRALNADSKEAYALLRDFHPYLSLDALERLARARESSGAQADQMASVSPQESTLMRDAVAESAPTSFFQRIAARVRALVARIVGPGR